MEEAGERAKSKGKPDRGVSKKNNKNETKRSIYLTIICSHIGYAMQVWARQTVEQIRILEQVQRRAAKYTLNLPFNLYNVTNSINLLARILTHRHSFLFQTDK